MPDLHTDLPDAGRISHFDIDTRLPTDAQKQALAYRYLVWIIPDPAVGTVGQVPVPWNCTVTEIKGNVDGGTSAAFNVEHRTTPGSAGTDILSSDMVADTDAETVSSGFNEDALTKDNYLAVTISAATGAVTTLTIRLKVRL
jgi:hypothetical protein